MNSTQHGDENTAALVAKLLDILSDPEAAAQLKQVRNRMNEIKRMRLTEEFHIKEARQGTCPTCGRKYVLNKKTRTLRRHGQGYCLSYDQLPAEVIPAIGVIAELGSVQDEGNRE